MKKFLLISVAYIFSLTIQAQKYVVDGVVADYTIATTDEFRWTRDFLTQSSHEAAKTTGSVQENSEIKIPNGTEVTVKAFGRSWVHENNTHVLATIDYNGATYYVHARDLIFAESNPEGTYNALDTIDFSPNKYSTYYVNENGERIKQYVNTLQMHSAEAKSLYNSFYYVCVVLLIVFSYILLLLANCSGKPKWVRRVILVTPLLMIAAIIIEAYLIVRLGKSAVWFIDPDFFTKTTCVLRSVPLIIVIVLQLTSFFLYCNLLPVKEGKIFNKNKSLVSTLISIIPAVVAGYFVAISLTGYSRSTSDATVVGHTWLAWGICIFILLLIWPLIYNARKLDADRSGIKSQFLLGLSTSAFMVIYWLGTIALIIILIFALIKLFLAILAQIFLWIVFFGFCGSKLGQSIMKTNKIAQPKFYDKSGGVHVSATDAQAANERIDNARDFSNPTH